MADSITYTANRITHRGSTDYEQIRARFGGRVPLIAQAVALKLVVATPPGRKLRGGDGPRRPHRIRLSDPNRPRRLPSLGGQYVEEIRERQGGSSGRLEHEKKEAQATPADLADGSALPGPAQPALQKERPMTDMNGRPILVAGATGRQGGSVVRYLLERQLTVRALLLTCPNGCHSP